MTLGRYGAAGRLWTVSIALILTIGCGSKVDPDEGNRRSVANQPPPASPTPGTPAADEIALSICSPPYSVEALPQKQFAFDGTVKELGERQDPGNPSAALGTAVFSINQWFKGGGPTELKLQSGLRLKGDVLPVTEGPDIRVGDRLLVSGNGAFLGPCGFTRMWTRAEASAWERALRS